MERDLSRMDFFFSVVLSIPKAEVDAWNRMYDMDL